MLAYAVRRIIGAIPTLLLLVVLTFFTLRLAPGGPFDTDRALPMEIQLNINIKYGLHDPLHVQFFNWLSDLAHGDLRESFQYLGRPVMQIISESFPISLIVGGLAFAVAVLLGVPLGAIAARKRGTWLDFSAMFMAIAGVSLPSYLVASVLVLVFALWLGWLPPALLEGTSSLILPVLTMSLRPTALIARLTRASMLEALQSDYIRTARSKGVSEFMIVFKHALRNSILPIVTILGPIATSLVTGSFLVEMVFQIPGMGKHFITAVINRDYPLVMGVTLFYGVLLIVANLIVDLLYAVVDPRIQQYE